MTNYFKLNLVNFNQDKSENIFTSVIKFSDLNKTARMRSRKDEPSLYQRELKRDRLNEIIKYIKNMVDDESNSLPIFPTPLVLAIDTDIEYENYLNENYKDDTDKERDFRNKLNKYIEIRNKYAHGKSFNNIEEELIYYNVPKPIEINHILFIPSFEEILFIVDGQHRYKAIELYCKEFENEKLKNEFQFLTTILVNYDIYQQSRIFASINFNQKPVNKSLYYDIFGSIYESRDEITFSHYLVKRFNNSINFKGIVKLLGTGTGIISLAFFVETIMYNLISKNGCFYTLYKDYENNTSDEYKKLPNFLINYFSFLKNNLEEYFPQKKDENTFNPYRYYLFKTTGLYGLLLILNDIIKDVDIISYERDKLYTFLNRKFKNILNDPKQYFENEQFMKTAGAGSQKRFYKLLKDNLYNEISKAEKDELHKYLGIISL